jgi:hypothetical protein
MAARRVVLSFAVICAETRPAMLRMIGLMPNLPLPFLASPIIRRVAWHIRRVGGQLVLFAHQKPPSDRAVLPRYRLLADDMVVREEPAGPLLARYVHPNRDIERAIAGLSVQNIHLQRNQMREILASKAGVG